ncbi:oligosaccharide flippase family protein [Staphylococcus simulans]|uniref:oligosaccharide flippase family protein n=1 Tax=Staphylococcus simulans TaxID=1286 RepID=UPI0021CEA63E|nr:oligosaccharide flippase family protein [Staphylococcus simulans]UXR35621.1 oligosaccharide flippase family protein [Staphylococcus simulans]UXR50257.1 oligosaccharide flippase family protein [Staphylococcus simulans]
MNQRRAGAILSYISIFGNILVAILYTPFFIRTLGTSEYGLYNLVLSFLVYLNIMDLAFGNTIAKYLSQNRVKGSKAQEARILGNILNIYFLCSLLVGLMGLVLYLNAEAVFGNALAPQQLSELKLMLIFIIINIMISFYPGIFNGILQAYEYFVIAKSMLLIRVIMPSIIATPFLLMGFGAVTIILITLIVNFACLFLGMILCRRHVSIRFDWKGALSFNHLKQQKQLNVYLGLVLFSIAIEQLTLNSGQMILGAINGTVAVAIYVIAVQFVKIFQQFATSINNVTFPGFSMLVVEGASNERLLQQMVRISRIQLIVLSFILSGFVIFGENFIVIWAGQDFRPAYLMTVVLMFTITFQLSQLPAVSIIQAHNRQTFRFMALAITLVLAMISAVILAPKYSGYGVSLSIAAFSFIGYTLIMNVYYHRKIGLNMYRFWFEMSKIWLPMIISTVIYYFIYQWIAQLLGKGLVVLGINIIVYVILYSVVLWTVIMNQSERQMGMQVIQRFKRA